MGLREIARADARLIAEDVNGGFGWPFVLVDPLGAQADLKGLDQDISQVIDPDSGMRVSGRQCSVVVHTSALLESFSRLPRAVADKEGKPWMVLVTNVLGKQLKFKVAEVNPDATIGLTTLFLEIYK